MSAFGQERTSQRHCAWPTCGRLPRLNESPKLGSLTIAVNGRKWVCSDLSASGQLERVLHINAEVANRAVDLGMAEQDLNGA